MVIYWLVRLLNLAHHGNFKDQFTEGDFFWFHKRKYQLKDSKGNNCQELTHIIIIIIHIHY